MKRAKTPIDVKREDTRVTDPRIDEYLARKHADALAKIKMWTDISKRVVSDKTRKLAFDSAAAQVGTNFGWLSAQVRAALVEFELDAWAGVEPSAHTLEHVRDIHPIFSAPFEPASQDRSVVKPTTRTTL
jgi:hypothetical protein